MVKKLEELNLIDNFLFEALASHPEIGAAFGRKLVEIILHRSPEKVKVVAQRTYPGSNPQMHGARLDVYLEESAAPGKNVSWSYDIEPEKDSKPMAVRSLPKRVWFYHAKIDAKGLKAGDSYHKLKCPSTLSGWIEWCILSVIPVLKSQVCLMMTVHSLCSYTQKVKKKFHL